MLFWQCFAAMTAVGIGSFFLGRLLPRRFFWVDCFPWRCYSWEREGKIYRRIFVHRWQRYLPDMSRILPGFIRPKRLEEDMDRCLPELIRETCVAELIHWLLCPAGLLCRVIWPGTGGKVCALLFMLGNLPYILVQRYNRPRLAALAHRRGIIR